MISSLLVIIIHISFTSELIVTTGIAQNGATLGQRLAETILRDSIYSRCRLLAELNLNNAITGICIYFLAHELL